MNTINVSRFTRSITLPLACAIGVGGAAMSATAFAEEANMSVQTEGPATAPVDSCWQSYQDCKTEAEKAAMAVNCAQTAPKATKKQKEAGNSYYRRFIYTKRLLDQKNKELAEAKAKAVDVSTLQQEVAAMRANLDALLTDMANLMLAIDEGTQASREARDAAIEARDEAVKTREAVISTSKWTFAPGADVNVGVIFGVPRLAPALTLGVDAWLTFRKGNALIGPTVGFRKFWAGQDTTRHNMPVSARNTMFLEIGGLFAGTHWFGDSKFGLFGALHLPLLVGSRADDPNVYNDGGVGFIFNPRAMMGLNIGLGQNHKVWLIPKAHIGAAVGNVEFGLINDPSNPTPVGRSIFGGIDVGGGFALSISLGGDKDSDKEKEAKEERRKEQEAKQAAPPPSTASPEPTAPDTSGNGNVGGTLDSSVNNSSGSQSLEESTIIEETRNGRTTRTETSTKDGKTTTSSNIK